MAVVAEPSLLWRLLVGLFAAALSAMVGAAPLTGTNGTPPATPVTIVLEAIVDDGRVPDPAALESAARVVARRLDALGVAEAAVAVEGDRRLAIQVPADAPVDAIVATVTTVGLLELVDPRGDLLLPGALIATTLGPPPGPATPAPVYETIVDGRDVEDAEAQVDRFGQRIVAFRLTPAGGEQLAAYTRAHLGEPLAIVVDKRIVSVPVIQAEIEREGVIAGLADEEIDPLVALLKAGPLGLRFRLIGRR